MDFDKVGRLHAALSATLLTVGTEEEATPVEVLSAALRMFSRLLAAYVSGTEAVHTARASAAAVDVYCQEVAAMAKAYLHDIRRDEPRGEQR